VTDLRRLRRHLHDRTAVMARLDVTCNALTRASDNLERAVARAAGLPDGVGEAFAVEAAPASRAVVEAMRALERLQALMVTGDADTVFPELPVDPGRVLLVGDTHADLTWWQEVGLPTARRVGASVILQVGDFGVWSRDQGRVVDGLEGPLAEEGRLLLYVEGNHEDFGYLLSVPVDEDGVRRLRPHIWHLPRGFRWVWSGQTFLACGGAGSPDLGGRVRGVDWWPQEAITPEDAERCLTGGACDVLVSHDGPVQVDPEVGYRGSWSAADRAWCAASRAQLQRVVEGTRPRLMIHGHYHEHHLVEAASTAYPARRFTVLGLNHAGGDHGSMAVLEPSLLPSGEAAALTIL
jgi:hypothetical protein